MFQLKKDLPITFIKEKYGFKYGSELVAEYADDERLKYSVRENWLYIFEEDLDEGGILYDEYGDNPAAEICIREDGLLYIDLIPLGTYHVMDWDAPKIFSVLTDLLVNHFLEWID